MYNFLKIFKRDFRVDTDIQTSVASHFGFKRRRIFLYSRYLNVSVVNLFNSRRLRLRSPMFIEIVMAIFLRTNNTRTKYTYCVILSK